MSSKLELTPPNGGDLITRISEDRVGAANYVEKRNWRRELNDEIRREGDEWFVPIEEGPTDQAFPAIALSAPTKYETILLKFTARSDSGKTALLAMSATRIWCFVGYNDNRVVEDDVLADGIVDTIGGGNAWLLIGSGFSNDLFANPIPRRWRARNVAGLTFISNGYDLPVTYRIGDYAVKPIHELREVGIGYVEHFEETNGVVLLGNVSEIIPALLPLTLNMGYFGPYPSSAQNISVVAYNTLWSDPVGPRRWGARSRAAMTVGSRIVTLENRLISVENGSTVRIVGAGLNGGDLITQFIRFVTPTTALVYDRALTTVAFEGATVAEEEIFPGTFSLADAATLSVASYPLLDDSTPILGMVKHKDQVVIAKESGFILAVYSGTVGNPFQFARVYTGKDGLFWKHTLIDVNGDYVLYAGQTGFFAFDLVGRVPREHPKLTLCQDIFFNNVTTQEEVWVADNKLTKEIWIGFTAEGPDNGLCLDYRQNTVSTIDGGYMAAATVDKPMQDAPSGAAVEQIFLLSTNDGRIMKYGFSMLLNQCLVKRREVSYESAIRHGLSDLADALNEKHLTQYLIFSNQQAGDDTALTVEFFGTRNIGDTVSSLGIKVLASPQTRNTIFMHKLLHLVSDRITVGASNRPRLSRRVWIFNRQGGSSFIRR